MGLGSGSGESRFRAALVVSEVALALVLLAGSGLLIRSLLRLEAIDPGFRPENLLAVELSLPPSRYPQPRQQGALYRIALERLASLPEVESAGAIDRLPLGGTFSYLSFIIEGRPHTRPGDDHLAHTRVASPEYFRTMGIPLIRGRFFSEGDREDVPGVAIINRTAAKRFWPGEDPLGRRIRFGAADDAEDPWITVVGVVGDVRHRGLDSEPGPEIYTDYLQTPSAFMNLVMRTRKDPEEVVPGVREAIRAVDPEQPIAGIQTMEQLLSDSLARRRFQMALLSIFAAIAVVLAAVGIYGLASFLVTERTREIGLRRALGAGEGDVFRLVVGRALILAGAGVAIGLLLAVLLSPVLGRTLYGVSPSDPATLVAISVLDLAVAGLASYLPARRVARIDPMVALRYE